MGFRIGASTIAETAGRGINTKRKILIIEDNQINQEMLASILGSKYELIIADNGEIGLELLKQHYRELSLVMLDVYMPICNGFQFLEKVKSDPLLATVPIIITTGSDDPKDEIKCLKMGVYDFVTKPYNVEIVLARVDHAISLRESIVTLSAVEFDSLTGLYTMQAFVHRAQKIFSRNDKKQFNLFLVDLQDFKLVNDNFGEEMGDEALKEVAKACVNLIPFFIATRDGDKFYFLCDGTDSINQDFIDKINNEINANLMIPALNIKYGVYYNIDTSVSVSILCDRVNMAIDSIKNTYNQSFAAYDASLREKMLENQKLESNFALAIENNEFYAWYQPKVDSYTGKIVGAEALVRWIPEMGKLVPPAKFIPLFERNGQIAELDEYIFEQVCRFQHRRLEEGKKLVPISVNLSRHSIYRNDVVKRYKNIADKQNIPLSLVPVELTESATTDSRIVQNFVTQATTTGFSIHMDDFGTGYSSIALITNLAFSVIKLDKSLIDQIGNKKGDILMKYMIAAASAIGMEVVAEGVENKEQIQFLKGVGCNIIQGYYYSPPINASVFVNLLDTDETLGSKA